MVHIKYILTGFLGIAAFAATAWLLFVVVPHILWFIFVWNDAIIFISMACLAFIGCMAGFAYVIGEEIIKRFK